MSALARDGAGRTGAAQVGLRRGRMGWLARSAAPGVGLGAGVSLRSTAEAAMATGEAAMATGEAAVLAVVQPADASSATLLTAGGSAVRVLLAILAGAGAADGPAGVVARALAGVLADTHSAVRLVATR